MTEPTAPQNSGPRSNPSFVVGALYASITVTLLWWALAFLPLPVPDPVLYNLRSVCFGTLPNGLPDTWGWLLLALSPVSIFGFLIAVWSDEIGPSLRHSLRSPFGRFVFAVALVSTIGTFGYAGYRVVTIKLAETAGSELDLAGEMPEDYPRTHKPAPDFTLINQYGAAVTLSSLRGSTVILTFAYAHCATVCPTIIHAARNGATQARQLTTNPVVLVFITLDPWRDTVSALPSLAEAWVLTCKRISCPVKWTRSWQHCRPMISPPRATRNPARYPIRRSPTSLVRMVPSNIHSPTLHRPGWHSLCRGWGARQLYIRLQLRWHAATRPPAWKTMYTARVIQAG